MFFIGKISIIKIKKKKSVLLKFSGSFVTFMGKMLRVTVKLSHGIWLGKDEQMFIMNSVVLPSSADRWFGGRSVLI